MSSTSSPKRISYKSIIKLAPINSKPKLGKLSEPKTTKNNLNSKLNRQRNTRSQLSLFSKAKNNPSSQKNFPFENLKTSSASSTPKTLTSRATFANLEKLTKECNLVSKKVKKSIKRCSSQKIELWKKYKKIEEALEKANEEKYFSGIPQEFWDWKDLLKKQRLQKNKNPNARKSDVVKEYKQDLSKKVFSRTGDRFSRYIYTCGTNFI